MTTKYSPLRVLAPSYIGVAMGNISSLNPDPAYLLKPF